MRDSYGRQISYLRLSVTDRCTLRCTYCRAEEGFCPKEKELTADDYIKIVRAMATQGIHRVRLTGGEPLLRKDILQIIKGIAAIDGIADLSMTTNAQMLAPVAPALKEAGLQRLNVSLDSLDPAVFFNMTGGDLGKVLQGIDAALTAGLNPIKVNVVLLRGRNDGEVDDFIAFTRERPIDVRFIEYMPIGSGNRSHELMVNNSELIRRRPYLQPLPPRYPGQPAIDYQVQGYQGRVGFISPISHRFCAACNRVRVLSDGKLRTCLGQSSETDLKPAIDQSEHALISTIQSAIQAKPFGHRFEQQAVEDRNMSRIGG